MDTEPAGLRVVTIARPSRWVDALLAVGIVLVLFGPSLIAVMLVEGWLGL